MGKHLTLALGIFALSAALLAIYTAGYLLLPDTAYWSAGAGYGVAGSLADVDRIDRIYSQQWMATAFRPAASIEQWICGIEVDVLYASDFETGSSPPIITPPTPAPVIHVADWPWVPEGEHGDGSYADFLAQVEEVQQQQMREIRQLGIRQVWVEGQSDKTIDEFRTQIEKLKTVESPADQVIREDLLQIGAAGRLLLAGEIDNVLPLEDHDAWQTAKLADGESAFNADFNRKQAISHRLPPGAVIVLGAEHDLDSFLSFSGITVRVIRVEALPKIRP